MTERVVLAYSGGLDTSVAIGWIAEETGAEVIAVAVDVGQGGEDLEVIRQRALDCGAVEAVVRRRAGRVRRRLLPAGAAGQRALHGPLPAGLRAVPAADRQAPGRGGRASTAPRSSRTAAPARATTRSASRSASARSRPTSRCIAPVRDYGMTRDKAIAFAEEKGLPIDVTQEVAVLDRPEPLGPRGRDRLPRGHLERARSRTSTPTPPTRRRRATPDEVVITFDQGVPVAIDGRPVTPLAGDRWSSTSGPARRASAGSTWSRTGWSASRAARSTRRPARSR